MVLLGEKLGVNSFQAEEVKNLVHDSLAIATKIGIVDHHRAKRAEYIGEVHQLPVIDRVAQKLAEAE